MQSEVTHHEKVKCWKRGEDLIDQAVKSGSVGLVAEVPFGSPSRSQEWLNSPGLRHRNLPEIFDSIILVSDRDGRARIGQGECHARTVLKLDFEVGLGFTDGFYLPAWWYRCRSGYLDLHV